MSQGVWQTNLLMEARGFSSAPDSFGLGPRLITAITNPSNNEGFASETSQDPSSLLL